MSAEIAALNARILALERRIGRVASEGGGSSVPTSRQVISGDGLTGGGDLSADRTLAVGAGTGITVNADDIAVNQSVLKLDDWAAPDDNTDLNASTTAHGLSPKATAPAAGLLNVLGIGNGETVRTDKAIFDTTNPAALGTAAPGTQLVAARRDHVHTLPKLDDLAAPDDNTDLDASASGHGLMPKWTSALISALLDLISSTRGAILYRGAAAWSALSPSTAGYVLTSNGPGADPSYEAFVGGPGSPSGGGVLEHIETVSPSAVTSIDLEGFAGLGYSYLEFIISLTVAVDAAIPGVRFKLNGAYKDTGSYHYSMTEHSSGGANEAPGATNHTYIPITGSGNFAVGADTLENYNGRVTLWFPDNTAKPKRIRHEGSWTGQTGNSVQGVGQGLWVGTDAANALTGVRIVCTQNMTGVIECYGRRP